MAKKGFASEKKVEKLLTISQLQTVKTKKKGRKGETGALQTIGGNMKPGGEKKACLRGKRLWRK